MNSKDTIISCLWLVTCFACLRVLFGWYVYAMRSVYTHRKYFLSMQCEMITGRALLRMIDYRLQAQCFHGVHCRLSTCSGNETQEACKFCRVYGHMRTCHKTIIPGSWHLPAALKPALGTSTQSLAQVAGDHFLNMSQHQDCKTTEAGMGNRSYAEADRHVSSFAGSITRC